MMPLPKIQDENANAESHNLKRLFFLPNQNQSFQQALIESTGDHSPEKISPLWNHVLQGKENWEEFVQETNDKVLLPSIENKTSRFSNKQ